MNVLSEAFKGVKIQRPARDGPLWEGPEGQGKLGGISFSMLSRYLCCPERFRIAYIEGLKPIRTFNARIDYGDMWHLCEEDLATKNKNIFMRLEKHYKKLCSDYRLQKQEITKWYKVCKVQFPEYVTYWSKHKDVTARTPLFQEEVFDVPYLLPSGRSIRLRGKFDSVDIIGTGRDKGLYVQENKTKGDIRPQQLERQLTFDLQTMIYLVALYAIAENHPVACKYPIKGVRYNVVKRPLSGGKGSIKPHKAKKSKPAETDDAFYIRLKGQINKLSPDFFMRWKIPVSIRDVKKFERETFIPAAERLCEWYDWIIECTANGTDFFSHPHGLHWRWPFGIYNVMLEGGTSDVDEYLATGSEIGLERVDTLFNELKP